MLFKPGDKLRFANNKLNKEGDTVKGYPYSSLRDKIGKVVTVKSINNDGMYTFVRVEEFNGGYLIERLESLSSIENKISENYVI